MNSVRHTILSTIWKFRCRFRIFRLFESLSSLLDRNQPTVEHLAKYQEEDAIGPIQRSEALLIGAICNVINPRVVVEFGFSSGHSAYNFLLATGNDARIYSFDIAPDALQISRMKLSHFSNFTLINKSQALFSAEDIDNKLIDFVFFDGAHDLQVNIETWKRVSNSLSEECIVGIHDTGIWFKQYFRSSHYEFAQAGKQSNWIDEERYIHQPDERKFVNWILANNPLWNKIQFSSSCCLRHGITLLQKGRALSV